MKVALAKILSLCQCYILIRDRYDECLHNVPQKPPYVPFYGTWGQDKCTANQFRLISKVGKGQFSKVYRAIHLKSGQEVALKKTDIFRPSIIPVVRNEECLLGSVIKEIPNSAIPDFFCAFVAGPSAFLVMEFIDGGTITGKDSAINYSQVLHGIGYLLDSLHRQGIAHMDVKPDNIMIAVDGSVKLIDYGFAGNVDRRVLPGFTPLYTAPEILVALQNKNMETNAPDLSQSDWYALGLTLYSLRHPLPNSLAGRSNIVLLAQHGVTSLLDETPEDPVISNLLEPKLQLRWKYQDILDYYEGKTNIEE